LENLRYIGWNCRRDTDSTFWGGKALFLPDYDSGIVTVNRILGVFVGF